jgi:trk system potassium uptake protein TrkA
MYIVIVGSTGFALYLSKLILSENHNKLILVVKKKEEALRISEQINVNVVNADASKPETLDDLELSKCDVFVAASESEKDNVLSAIYAKSAGAKKIFVSIDNPDTEDILDKLGLVPINSEKFAAHSVELMITRPSVSELVNLGMGEFDIIEVKAKDTKLVGKDLNLAKGKNFTAIATYANGKYNFSKDAKINVCDTLLLIVSAGKERLAEKEIGKAVKRRMDLICKIKDSLK